MQPTGLFAGFESLSGYLNNEVSMSKEKPFDFRSAADTCLGIERVVPTKEEREKFQAYRWNGREYVPMRKS